MADTRDDLWISLITESDEPDDTAPLDVATAKNLVRAHNESETAHADIRAQLQEIADAQTTEIKEYPTKRNFPASGDTSVTIYVDVSTGNLYRYNTNSREYEALAMDAIPSSIVLEGTPMAPTANMGNNSTQIATTAFVQNELAALREQSESTTPVYYDSRTKAKLSLLGENGTIVTNVANGKVEQGSADAITGDQLWRAQQDMANMSALAARNIAANAAEIDLLKRMQNPWENLTDENKDALTNLISVIEGNGVEVVETVDENRVKTFTVSAKAPEGEVAENNAKTVTGGAVYTAIEEAKSALSEEIANKVSLEDLDTAALQNQVKIINGDHTAAMLGETDGQQTYAINVRANGVVQRNDGRLITGNTVYVETRIEEDGHKILANNTAAQNIQILDEALNSLSGLIIDPQDTTALTEDIEALKGDATELRESIEDFSDSINTLANRDLSNLTDNGEAVIRNLISNSEIKIINGDHTIATLGEEEGQTTYAINVRANGAIAYRDGRIVTGQTVYNEVRPNDGNYVNSDYTTGANLNALDTQIKVSADAVEALTETVNGFDSLISSATDSVATFSDRMTAAETALETKAEAGSVYTKEEADALLEVKANAADVYTKSESEELFAGKDFVYTKEEFDAALADKANASDVYTKEEINAALETKVDADTVYTKAETDEKMAAAEQTVAELAEQVETLSQEIPDVEYHAGEYIRISDSNTISVKVNGAVQEGSVGIVTGEKIAQAITNSEVRTGNVIQHVHDELTHRIELLENGSGSSGSGAAYSYALLKDDETNQLLFLKEGEVVSRIQLATDTDTKYSLEKIGNEIRLIPNDDPTQAIPITLDPDINTTYTLALENNQLIFTANDDSDPVVIDLPDAVTHSELINYAQISDLENYVQNSVLEAYAKTEDLAAYATQEALTQVLEANAVQDERIEAVEALADRIEQLEESEDKDTVYTAGDGVKISDDNVISVDNRTVYKITANNGNESLIFNESDGGGAKFTNAANNTAAFVGVNDGSGNIDVQLYAVDKTAKTGTRININPTGAYYTVTNSPAFTPDDEILVRRDLGDHEERITALENKEDENTIYQAGEGITIDDNDTISVDNRTIYMVTAENGDASTVFNETDGAGMQYVNMMANTVSFVGVDNGSDYADIHIFATDQTTKVGSRISVNRYGAYYTVQDSAVFGDEDEILTRRDIDAYAKVNGVTVYESFEDFPEDGVEGKLYIDASGNMPYRWDPDDEKYVEVSGNKHIDSLTDEDIDSLF